MGQQDNTVKLEDVTQVGEPDIKVLQMEQREGEASREQAQNTEEVSPERLQGIIFEVLHAEQLEHVHLMEDLSQAMDHLSQKGAITGADSDVRAAVSHAMVEIAQVEAEEQQAQQRLETFLSVLARNLESFSPRLKEYRIPEQFRGQIKESNRVRVAEVFSLFPDGVITVGKRQITLETYLGSGGAKDVFVGREGEEQSAISCFVLDGADSFGRITIENEFDAAQALQHIPGVLNHHELFFFDKEGNPVDTKDEAMFAIYRSDIIEGKELGKQSADIRREILGDFPRIKEKALDEVKQGVAQWLKDHSFAEALSALKESGKLAPIEEKAILQRISKGDDDSRKKEVLLGFMVEVKISDLVQERIARNFEKLQGRFIDSMLPQLESVGTALDEMHRTGYAHADIKPDNIVGDTLIDLSLTQREGETLDEDAFLGTTAYKDPHVFSEQFFDHLKEGVQRHEDIRAFAISLLKIFDTSFGVRIPTFVEVRNKVTKQAIDFHKFIWKDLGAGYYYEEASGKFGGENKFAKLQQLYQHQLKLPEVLSRALQTFETTEENKAAKKDITAEQLVQAFQEWVEGMSADQFIHIEQQMTAYKDDPESYIYVPELKKKK